MKPLIDGFRRKIGEVENLGMVSSPRRCYSVETSAVFLNPHHRLCHSINEKWPESTIVPVEVRDESEVDEAIEVKKAKTLAGENILKTPIDGWRSDMIYYAQFFRAISSVG